MAIHTPGRHPAFEPIGRLRKSPFKAGKKNLMMPLNLTAMIDMFTVLVIFLIQNFSATGELTVLQKGLQLPPATQAMKLDKQGPVLVLMPVEKGGQKDNGVFLDGKEIALLSTLDEADAGIPPLTEQLRTAREKAEELSIRMGKPRDPTQPYDGHLIVQSDKATDFQLVRKAIFSINEAGWTHLQFLTIEAPKSGTDPTAPPS